MKFMELHMKSVLQLLLLALMVFISEAKSDVIQIVRDISLGESVYSLEEWKYPGKYSPVNAFDGDPSTCFAEDTSDNGLSIKVRFKEPIHLDEINIMDGFTKSKEYFYKNNRIKEVKVIFYFAKNRIGEEIIKLKDQMEFQKLKLKNDYKVDFIYLYSMGENIYKGTKYDDTCITEIEFYYKGKKVEIKNTEQLQKDYLDRLNKDYHRGLEDHTYYFTPKNDRTHIIKFYKNGTIDYLSSVYNPGWEVKFRKDKKFRLSDHIQYRYWKLEDLKLYMRNNKDTKWKLMKFQLKARDDYQGGEKFEFILYKNENDKSGLELRDATRIHEEAKGW